MAGSSASASSFEIVKCVCDPGFSVIDVLSRPSCELNAARSLCHAVGCVTSMLCFAVAVRQFCSTAKSGRRGVVSVGVYTRPVVIRAVLFATMIWSASILTFHVISLLSRLSLQTLLFPLLMWSVAWGATGGLFTLRLWLFTLPSRLLRKTSISALITVWADERHGLVVLSLCYSTWLVGVGIVGFFSATR